MSSDIRCTTCGTMLAKQSPFCPECGAALVDNEATGMSVERYTAVDRLLVATAVVLTVAILAVGVVWLAPALGINLVAQTPAASVAVGGSPGDPEATATPTPTRTLRPTARPSPRRTQGPTPAPTPDAALAQAARSSPPTGVASGFVGACILIAGGSGGEYLTELNPYGIPMTATEGFKWVLVAVIVANQCGSGSHYSNPNYFSLVTVDGRVVEYDSATFGAGAFAFSGGTTLPGTQVEGGLLFQIRSEDAPWLLVYDSLDGGVQLDLLTGRSR